MRAPRKGFVEMEDAIVVEKREKGRDLGFYFGRKEEEVSSIGLVGAGLVGGGVDL